MQTAFELSMEDSDTLQGHYQPTNEISEEALNLIKAWEASFSKPLLSQNLESNCYDSSITTDLSQPPQRYYRRKAFPPKKILKVD